MTYKLAIFDFDGTLADSFPFFAASFNELALRHGFRTVAAQDIQALRRLSARELMRHLGLPARKLHVVAADFIGLMRERRDSISAFPGAVELLTGLRRAGVGLGIVSSNAYDNVVAILGPSATAEVQHFACGMSIFGKRAHLRKVIKRSGVGRSAAIYIGDQTSDLEAAHGEGLAFGAVAWGYGDFAALQAAGSEHAFRAVSDIADLLRCSSE